MNRLLLALLLLTAGLAGCIDSEDAQHDDIEPINATNATTDRTITSSPDAVIAFIDNGINPYHGEFRTNASRAEAHPSTYLPDYPENATTLHLTFDHDSLEEAVRADCEAWERVEPGKLYWVPGTRIVGATALDLEWVDEAAGEDFSCASADDGWPLLIEGGEHGSQVASRGAGNAYGACKTCLVVAVDWVADPPSGALWAAEQPWIDIQSNSWVWQASKNQTMALEAASQAMITFISSGNEGPASAREDHRHRTPSMIRVGGHDSGRIIVWPGPGPHVVSDMCNAWTAEHERMDGVTPTSFGTSFSAPFAAGIAGEILLEARSILDHNRTGGHDRELATGASDAEASGPLADGDFTIRELKQVLLSTADPRPEEIEEDGNACETSDTPSALSTPLEWRQVPEGPAGIPLIGYGAVTQTTAEHAFDVLRGEEPMPERPAEDAYFEADQRQREAAYEAYTGTSGSADEAAVEVAS